MQFKCSLKVPGGGGERFYSGNVWYHFGRGTRVIQFRFYIRVSFYCACIFVIKRYERLAVSARILYETSDKKIQMCNSDAVSCMGDKSVWDIYTNTLMRQTRMYNSAKFISWKNNEHQMLDLLVLKSLAVDTNYYMKRNWFLRAIFLRIRIKRDIIQQCKIYYVHIMS